MINHETMILEMIAVPGTELTYLTSRKRVAFTHWTDGAGEITMWTRLRSNAEQPMTTDDMLREMLSNHGTFLTVSHVSSEEYGRYFMVTLDHPRITIPACTKDSPDAAIEIAYDFYENELHRKEKDE